MLANVLEVSEFKLSDLLGSAGATIGIIIAGTIFLQFLSTKYGELFARYRALTGEYRGRKADESRHDQLQPQIRTYRRRLRLMSWASWGAAVALLCFILAVLAGGLSVAYPDVRLFKGAGTLSLLLGLVLIGVAVFLELLESVMARGELYEEVADLDAPARRGAS